MIALSASAASGIFNDGLAHFHARRIREALACFEESERLGGDGNECASGRWMCWMLLSEFDRAWIESARIAASGVPDPNRYWDGRPFRGNRVILRCLHGYGDAIQFIRYAPMLRAQAAWLVVETHPELTSLLRGARGIDEVITWGGGAPARAPQWDQQIEIMELPRAFATTVRTIPAAIPYLYADPVRVERSRVRLGNSGKRKIGLLWASSNYNPARSVSLQALVPILELRQFDFYSLQRGPERDELQGYADAFDIFDTSVHSPEIADTAADMMELDLIITVDTMATHLAGALGRPVWTLLPFQADWRWMLDRTDSPWYPTMRLFRQPAPGDWKGAIAALRGELKNSAP